MGRPEEHRENLVILTHDEVKNFWLEGFGSFLFVARIYKDKDKTAIKIGIRNFLKESDGMQYAVCPFLEFLNKRCRVYKTGLYPLNCESYPYINLLYKKPALCEGRISGMLGRREAEIAQNNFRKIRLNESFGIDEDFGKFKEIIIKKGPFLVCQRLLTSLFGEPGKELKPEFQKVIDAIQMEHQLKPDKQPV